MLIDCNVHVGRWPFRRLPVEGVSSLLRLMDREGIDRALVAPLESVFLRDGQQGNEGLCTAAAGNRDRLELLACLRPGAPGAMDDLRRCRERWGFVGLKLHPMYHACPVTGPATRVLVAAAGELDMFVSISVRMEDNRFHTPVGQVPDVPMTDVLTFCGSFPDVRILVTNLNRGEYPALARDALFRRGNVFVEPSELDGPYDPIGDLIRVVGADHVVFGTHTPLRVARRALIDFQKAQIDEPTRRAIGETNALRLLGASA